MLFIMCPCLGKEPTLRMYLREWSNLAFISGTVGQTRKDLQGQKDLLRSNP